MAERLLDYGDGDRNVRRYLAERVRLRRELLVNWMLRDVHVRNLHVGAASITVSPAGVGDVIRWSATKAAIAAGDIGMDVTTGRLQMYVGGVTSAAAIASDITALGTSSTLNQPYVVRVDRASWRPRSAITVQAEGIIGPGTNGGTGNSSRWGDTVAKGYMQNITGNAGNKLGYQGGSFTTFRTAATYTLWFVFRTTAHNSVDTWWMGVADGAFANSALGAANHTGLRFLGGTDTKLTVSAANASTQSTLAIAASTALTNSTTYGGRLTWNSGTTTAGGSWSSDLATWVAESTVATNTPATSTDMGPNHLMFVGTNADTAAFGTAEFAWGALVTS